eukprot:5360410-Prymnesium_polylepis.1
MDECAQPGVLQQRHAAAWGGGTRGRGTGEYGLRGRRQVAPRRGLCGAGTERQRGSEAMRRRACKRGRRARHLVRPKGRPRPGVLGGGVGAHALAAKDALDDAAPRHLQRAVGERERAGGRAAPAARRSAHQFLERRAVRMAGRAVVVVAAARGVRVGLLRAPVPHPVHLHAVVRERRVGRARGDRAQVGDEARQVWHRVVVELADVGGLRVGGGPDEPREALLGDRAPAVRDAGLDAVVRRQVDDVLVAHLLGRERRARGDGHHAARAEDEGERARALLAAQEAQPRRAHAIPPVG